MMQSQDTSRSDDAALMKQFNEACRRLGWMMLIVTGLAFVVLIGWMLSVAMGDRGFDTSKLVPQSLVVVTIVGVLALMTSGVFKNRGWAVVLVAMVAALGFVGSAWGLVLSFTYRQGYIASISGVVVSAALSMFARDASVLSRKLRKHSQPLGDKHG
jgi:hypothetical protein